VNGTTAFVLFLVFIPWGVTAVREILFDLDELKAEAGDA